MDLKPILACLALLAAPASGQELRYGFSIGLSVPLGDTATLVDHKPGYAVGGHVAIPLGDGHALRPRFDISVLSHNTAPGTTLGVTTGCLGVDYNYFVRERAHEGFYLLAGMGYASTRFSITDNSLGPYLKISSSSDKGAFALAAGCGFQFGPTYGVDLRYTATKPDGFKNHALNLSLILQF